MKGKLFLLLGIGFVPLALTGQTTYLYNKGSMSVKTSSSANTALYIGGDLKSEATGSIVLEKAQIVLTGDLYRYGANNTAGHVFDATATSSMGTGVGPAAETDRSRLIFRNATTAQNVWKTSGANMDFTEKANNAIYFPDIVIDNPNHVTIHPEIGASAYNVKPIKGRLILESRKLTSTDVLPTPEAGASTIHSVNNSSVLAHLLVKGQHQQSFSTAESEKWAIDIYPGVQVNLALEKVASNSNDRLGGDPIVGMGSPFKAIRADYFMWNFLFLPSGNSIFNEDGNTTTDPMTKLEAGRGFVVGIDLRGPNGSVYDDIHSFYRTHANHGYAINFNQRVTEKYEFNRFAYGNKNYNNIYQVSKAYTTAADAPVNDNSSESFGVNVRPSVSDAYTGELLLGGVAADKVERKLVKGYNYLSNPFTCPLDVSQLIAETSGTNTAGNWGVKPGFSNGGTVKGDVANRVWVMDPSSVASGTYNIWSGGTESNPGNKWVVAHYRYRLIAHIASTTIGAYDNGAGSPPNGPSSNGLIAPLQMFLVFANTQAVDNNVSITIPADQRKIDENALFLRSEGNLKYEPDDFLFQVEDVDKGTTDRAAIVLRTFSEINKAGYQDIKKLTVDVSSNEDGKTRAVTSEGTTPKTSPMSAIYTQDSDGNALESRFLSLDLNSSTTSTTLYLKPSLAEHQITIRSFRNYTKDRISEIWLDDSKTGKKTKLSEGETYTTTSSPKDNTDRFTLRFIYPAGGIGDEGIVNPDDTNITAHYANNTLTVSGFNDSDYGSLVSVYDIQGRLLKQQKVDDTTVKFYDGFTVGAYIVKVTGNRSYATKFLAR